MDAVNHALLPKGAELAGLADVQRGLHQGVGRAGGPLGQVPVWASAFIRGEEQSSHHPSCNLKQLAPMAPPPRPFPTFCATPVMPTLLLPTAPTLPAVCVPCPPPDASPKLKYCAEPTAGRVQPTGGSYDLHVTALQQRRELRQTSTRRQLVIWLAHSRLCSSTGKQMLQSALTAG